MDLDKWDEKWKKLPIYMKSMVHAESGIFELNLSISPDWKDIRTWLGCKQVSLSMNAKSSI
jgi:hypothetical protein